jgi:hypothetical protein
MSQNPTPSVEPISLVEFLESVPPAQAKTVTTQISPYEMNDDTGEITSVRFAIPQIQLHCPSDSCNGERFFRAAANPIFLPLSGQYGQYEYLVFTCANCQKYVKTFALAIFIESSKAKAGQSFTAYCHKIGEYPPFGPPTPSRLISLIGPDRELFLKGRRAENQGLGIGAFVYYRRVVEDQKNRIIAEIIKVAEMISAPSATITALRNAQKEHQFSRAVETIKDAIPQRLLIAGQNPFTLLHSALSRGLHEQTDEKCLELAADIRVILVELSELLSHALKDDKELKEAVARLVRQP